MSRKLMSFESRLTIITTEAGSVILTVGACAFSTAPAQVAAMAANSVPVKSRRPRVIMVVAPDAQNLESCLQPDTRQQVPELRRARGRVDHVLQREGEPQLLGHLQVVVAL